MATHDDPKDQVDQEKRPADSGSDSVDDTASSVRNPESGCFTGPTLQRLEQGDKFYEIIKNSFVTGMKHLGKNTDVVGICRKIYDVDDIAKARSRDFSAAVGDKNDGDPNINLGWYGGSRDEISDILSSGFGRSRFRTQIMARVHGIYLTPQDLSIESLRSSVVDPDGLRHMLLCRVILGKSEEISPDSDQCRPSSVKFDSGVDDLSSPNWYIIWGCYSETHILPLSVVSFKVDYSNGYSNVRRLKPPRLTFSRLLKLLEDHVPVSKTAVLTKEYHKFREGKSSRRELLRSLNEIAGDEVLKTMVEVHGPKVMIP